MIGNRRLILIVEDNAVTRRALQALFKSRGWAVSVAETVAEGLRNSTHHRTLSCWT